MTRFDVVTDLLVVAGLAFLGWGLWQVYQPLAAIVLGLLCLAAGIRRVM